LELAFTSAYLFGYSALCDGVADLCEPRMFSQHELMNIMLFWPDYAYAFGLSFSKNAGNVIPLVGIYWVTDDF